MIDPNTLSRSRFRPVGITKGPGETTHEYTFVSRDDEQVLKNGEYVYYELSEPGDGGLSETWEPSRHTFSRRVLGRIIKRVPLQLYPDTFLAEPEISPTEVAAMVGYDARANELFELHVAIMGYYEEATGSFINPWIPPQSGKQIFLADDEMLTRILSRKQATQPGSATIGSLLTRAPGAVPIVLGVKDFVSTHLAIIASTGAGKSYLASVIVEELMQPHNKACILIIDPHGEYGTLDQIANHDGFSEKGDEDSEGADDSSTVHALTWRIDQRFVDSFTFDDMQHLDLPEIFKPGQCTVLQLNDIDERDQQVVVATLLRRLNKARMETERGKVHAGEFYLPYPVFVLIEEAHHFAPSGTEVVSTAILKQVLAEGRKFGIGVGLISQRPGKLDADVLSQCQTQCIMRIVNEIDQKSVASAIEGVGRDLLDNLPALSKGQVIVAGAAVNTPVICRVRTRFTRHGGESKDAPDMWRQYFSRDKHESRRRAEAPLNGNKGFNLLR